LRVPVLAGDERRQPRRVFSEPSATQSALGTVRQHQPRIGPADSWSELAAPRAHAPLIKPNQVPSQLSPSVTPSPPKPSGASPSIEPQRAATLLPRVVPLQAMPFLRPAARQGDEPRASADIHVTIGRVEVRATTTTPVRTQAKPAATPAMGLDEYLRRRANGGSR
jgi:hypothetical protein